MDMGDDVGTDMKVMLKALQKQVIVLEKDLTPTGKADPRLSLEWRAAKSAGRTAATFETWLGERVTQVAVAWVLGTVFLRFCEDNGLIESPFIAGLVQPDDRLQLAQDRQVEYFHAHPEHTDRDWLLAGFDAMSVSPVAAGLFDKRHNPMWTIRPSHDAIKALLAFWRQTGPDGEIVYNVFTDKEWNTRFLGDLYQDLSESARKSYALLQTPDYVEQFILKYTLKPAIEEFGLEPAAPSGHENLPHRLRMIDPACGSGHFLLGAFDMLLEAWEEHSLGATDRWTLIAEVLGSIHGVDKNPFAVAIARFRLMLTAMRRGGIDRLTKDLDFPLNIAVGDSLLHGKGAPGRQGQFNLEGDVENHTYRTEDIDEFIKSVRMLEAGSYHVVVGNPPYITVKDKAENEIYKKSYPSCYMQYALSVPFAERIFQLAIQDVGYTGQITSNSFMKREFGKKLIEEFFPKVDLTHVIDTSGAYIPGHGTPTVIIFGHRRSPRSRSTVHAILGIRGEPTQPARADEGYVWRAIVGQVERPGNRNDEWVSAADIERSYFASHPWSLSGGGAAQLLSLVESAPGRLGAQVAEIGRTTVVGEDDAWTLPRRSAATIGAANLVKGFVIGESVRDFTIAEHPVVWNPYSNKGQTEFRDEGNRLAVRILWPVRAVLENRVVFGRTLADNGRPWYAHLENYTSKMRTPLSISFAFVATHNHFVMDRGGKLFKQSAPVIKLPEGTTEDDHLALLGVLNSSTTCFWLKQVSQAKAGTSNTSGGGDRWSPEPWYERYEFTGTKLEEFPLPAELPLEFGRQLDSLAQRLASLEPAAVCASGTPTRARLDAAHAEHQAVRGKMIGLQEELDWDVYQRYGLISGEEASGLIAEAGDVPELKLGERAFEIVLARRVAAGEAETQWFARHRSVPITEIPQQWPQGYREVVARRIAKIERDRNIGLIERPECKRRWQSDPWEDKERAALRAWLLDRCEQRSLWFGANGEPAAMTVNRLADCLRPDAGVVSVARLLAGPDADLADVLRDVVSEEHVPFLAAYRYKPSGMDKRRQWERTWDQQREEDATGKKLDIPVPPKYASADFTKPSYWRHRGKLDVPKERFISYPGASPDSDAGSLLLGWAGWDHREQASVLVSLIESRISEDGWDTPKLTGLLAGLLEVMPWVRQWHGEVADGHDQSWAEAYDGYLTAQREERRLTEDDLRSWAPPQAGRGRRRSS
jgi:hypothetical protein